MGKTLSRGFKPVKNIDLTIGNLLQPRTCSVHLKLRWRQIEGSMHSPKFLTIYDYFVLKNTYCVNIPNIQTVVQKASKIYSTSLRNYILFLANIFSVNAMFMPMSTRFQLNFLHYTLLMNSAKRVLKRYILHVAQC